MPRYKAAEVPCLVCRRGHVKKGRAAMVTLVSGRQCWLCPECAVDRFRLAIAEEKLDESGL